MLKWILGGACLLAVPAFLFFWSLCVIAKRSDERMAEIRRKEGIGMPED